MIQPVLTPITGYEDRDDPQEPVGALAEFYRAFNGRDLALMERNWDSSDEASMDNPLGGIRRGWNEIRKVYERIFSGKATVKVEFYDYVIHRFSDTFLAVGRERGTLNTQDASLDLKIRTSRWFRMIDGRWRQVHHHGSIEDADLLVRYQAMVS
jgi:ketosteroid isomerase-like protein